MLVIINAEGTWKKSIPSGRGREGLMEEKKNYRNKGLEVWTYLAPAGYNKYTSLLVRQSPLGLKEEWNARLRSTMVCLQPQGNADSTLVREAFRTKWYFSKALGGQPGWSAGRQKGLPWPSRKKGTWALPGVQSPWPPQGRTAHARWVAVATKSKWKHTAGRDVKWHGHCGKHSDRGSERLAHSDPTSTIPGKRQQIST